MKTREIYRDKIFLNTIVEREIRDLQAAHKEVEKRVILSQRLRNARNPAIGAG